MKYLVITEPRGNLPPDIAARLFAQAQEWLRAKSSDGTLDFVHGFPAGGGVSVSNADSHEQLMEDIRAFPLFPFVSWDIRPLVNIDASFESAAEMFRKMAG